MSALPRHAAARYRPTGPPVFDEPAWFAEWFDLYVPADAAGPGFGPLQLAALLGIGKDIVYRALYDGRLEGIRISNKGWLVPRPAVRLWLVEFNSLNLD